MEIHNLYSLDLFLQGFFLSLCIFLGLFIIFRDNLEKYNEPQSVNNLAQYLRFTILTGIRVITLKNIPGFEKEVISDEDKFNNLGDKKTRKNKSQYNILLLIPIGIAVSFVVGIMGNSLADEWIDSGNHNHLFLKPLWGGEIAGKISSNVGNKWIENDDTLLIHINSKKFIYKKLLRLESFKRAFKDIDVLKNENEILQLYYHSKHKIIENGSFKNYIRKNQIISEYNRVFALGFYFLTICGLINLLIMIIRVFSNDTKLNIKDSTESKENNTIKEKGKLKNDKDVILRDCKLNSV